ncbi:MAG: DNA polymerase III subunit gamma/tau [Eubacteriales bacterium]|nr:DNA polymerase III subunit gamma/tau [Eubacteriales bacterium]
MAHISLYRKYRPDTFEGVFGQDHIVRTLKNQVKTGNVSHAYLFTGTRGTGKTSTARIFARAINCEHPVDGSPCGKCDCCKEAANPACLDILEIDAASNNGVDEIRDLREKVKYPPVTLKYKVYIIDEVHMLSTPAFNALLKTLEEPPKHAVFILATTEVHKLPATILSRCMRFDFRLVSTELLAKNLADIFDKEGRKYQPEALRLIATAGAGSVRDSLSIADMCLSYCDEEITYDKVLEALGASDPNLICSLCGDIISSDVGAALKKINKLSSCGKNMAVLASDVAECFRNVLYVKNIKDADDELGLPKPILAKLKTLSETVANSRILLILDIFNGISGELRFSSQPQIVVEAAIARAATEKDVSTAAIVAGCKKLEQRIMQLEARGLPRRS